MRAESVLATPVPLGFCSLPPAGMDYVVEVDAITPCWLSDIEGDPGRTSRAECATRYPDVFDALAAMSAARASYAQRKYSIGIQPKRLAGTVQ